MLTLHDYLPSLNGWKIRVLLGKLGIPYQTKPVAIFAGESRTEEFLAKNPAGAIPVLELEDGRSLAESNAILTYLAEGTPFLPQDRYLRAKVMQWLFFEQYYVEPAIGTLRFWTLTGRLERNAGGMVDARRETGARALAAMQRVLKSSPSWSARNSRSPTSRFMLIRIAPRIAVFPSRTTPPSPLGANACRPRSGRVIRCLFMEARRSPRKGRF